MIITNSYEIKQITMCNLPYTCIVPDHLGVKGVELPCITAIFTLAVSSTVLVHDVSASTGDMLMGITIFPIGRFSLLLFQKLSDGCGVDV